ncbi:hypothetical protein CFP56_029734 [Quercus suber]|uniref:DC1 domain-containing protein n=1 Tax=Quercus suber TaxID=58331 RepID=A0AAW0LVB1_QUESU
MANIVMGAMNQYCVRATVVKNAMGTKLPLGLLHHPLHPLHPLILFSPWRYSNNNDFSNCQVYKLNRSKYCYGCFRRNFKLHIGCGSLVPTMEVAEAHLGHPLTLLCKWIIFTCDLCGKEDNGMPYLYNPCGFGIHRRRAIVHVDLNGHTHYGLYYCSICDFVAHLDCAITKGNIEDINLLELKEEESIESKAMLENVKDSKLDQAVDSEICKVVKIAVREDETDIAT